MRTPKEYITLVAKGIAMGAADVVPGVSGGTIAFISGIYEELLNSISSFNLGLLKVLRAEGVKGVWKAVNGSFLIALFAGIGISFATLSKVVTHIMDTQPVLLWSFFFGLVIASIIYVGKQVEKWNLLNIIGLLAGGAIAYYITVLPPLTANAEPWFLFLAGMIAICAMILPGISGSFILLLLGAYGTIMEAVAERDLMVIGIVGAGCLVGLLSFARVLKFLFAKYKGVTIATLTGFLVGSLNKLWPWKHVEQIFVKHAGDPEKEEVVNLVERSLLPGDFDQFERAGNEIVSYSEADPQLMYAVLLMIAGASIIFVMEFVAKKMSADA